MGFSYRSFSLLIRITDLFYLSITKQITSSRMISLEVPILSTSHRKNLFDWLSVSKGIVHVWVSFSSKLVEKMENNMILLISNAENSNDFEKCLLTHVNFYFILLIKRIFCTFRNIEEPFH